MRIPLLVSALTHVHVGAGRAPGAVDLPVIKDPFGVPYIPGSSFKGAIKSQIANSLGCVSNGNVNCGKCMELCCSLGPDTAETEKGASRLVFSDLYPLLFPISSLEEGYVYITSPLLLQKFESLVGKEIKVNKGKGKVSIGLDLVEVLGTLDPLEIVGAIKEGLSADSVHPFLRGKKVYVLEDSKLIYYMEKGLVRLTRIRLDKAKKTVAKGALWTEEYVPHGTIFGGLVVERAWDNPYCKDCNDCTSFVKEKLGEVLILGGKETVGKGMVKVVW